MIALLVIDMQVGLFDGDTPRHDAQGVVSRINDVARAVRSQGGMVVFVQHTGPAGDPLEPHTPGWELLPALERAEGDLVVSKSACDAFYDTPLAAVLTGRGADALVVAGCATDFCVDTTVRAAASRDFAVTVVADGHTTGDRPHLAAEAIIHHHNWMWQNLILPRAEVRVVPAATLIADAGVSAEKQGV